MKFVRILDWQESVAETLMCTYCSSFQRLEDVRNRHTAKDSTAEDSRLITTATRPEAAATATPARETVSVSTETDGSQGGDGELRQECVRLKGVARRLREERSALQESVAKKE